ncbi:RNA polymerase sigma factor [Pedobacter mendelii]|uniref:RNA polymerase sigma factor n=1 Tax=Pedobacter mendelii TaxID=1908240 RepID=A0ABQ2BMA5_9SPHI|nr:RNA polymerase sigma factor [Pedobacter mendelii]GGI29568.1 RNA polymerase sigma factor [Pedobacter mendelii]
MTNTQFTQIITQHNTSLYNFALKFTKDADDANDLLQDTMMKAIKFLNKFEEGTNIKGWLFTIMRNTFINNYRRRIKVQSIVTQEEDISSYNLLHSSTRNDSETSFAMGDIKRALSGLTDTYSVPFVRYVEGYKYEEIAIELGIPIGTVKTRIHQARKHLQKQLQMYKERIN